MSTNGKMIIPTPEREPADFHFWWFVTRRCNNHCPHCLRYDIGDVGEELSAPMAKRVLLEWIDWLRRHQKKGSIAFGGANPICREDLPDLLHICKSAADEGIFTKRVGILANPQGIDLAYAKVMYECGIRRFTLSLDGMKETNDAMRGPGNFDAAVKCMDILAEAGIERDIKFTCIKKTYKEYPQVVALAKAHGIDRVMPGRLILEGGGKECADQALSDEEWEAFLKENHIEHPFFARRRPDSNSNNQTIPKPNNSHFVLMAGGEFRPNRRGPALGHWPEEPFDELMEKLAKFVPTEVWPPIDHRREFGSAK